MELQCEPIEARGAIKSERFRRLISRSNRIFGGIAIITATLKIDDKGLFIRTSRSLQRDSEILIVSFKVISIEIIDHRFANAIVIGFDDLFIFYSTRSDQMPFAQAGQH